MKIAAALILSALVSATLGLSSANAQSCPAGSYPWVDSWGNKICKRHSDGSTASTEVRRGQTCPIGSHEWVDRWGEKVCRTAGGDERTDSYDVSKGCPTGTHEWVDSYGNKVCKR